MDVILVLDRSLRLQKTQSMKREVQKTEQTVTLDTLRQSGDTDQRLNQDSWRNMPFSDRGFIVANQKYKSVCRV